MNSVVEFLKAVAINFATMMLVIVILINIVFFISWDYMSFEDVYLSDGFISLTRMVLLFSIIGAMFGRVSINFKNNKYGE